VALWSSMVAFTFVFVYVVRRRSALEQLNEKFEQTQIAREN
jgi:hypothetical protein